MFDVSLFGKASRLSSISLILMAMVGCSDLPPLEPANSQTTEPVADFEFINRDSRWQHKG